MGDPAWAVNTQYNIHTMDYGIVHLKPINGINLCRSNKFNTS